MLIPCKLCFDDQDQKTEFLIFGGVITSKRRDSGNKVSKLNNLTIDWEPKTHGRLFPSSACITERKVEGFERNPIFN